MTFALACAGATMASPAYAYIDPGSASIVLQAIVGGLAAGAFALKMYWHRVRRFFGLKSGDPEKRSDRAGG